jgi:hypothetical protein
MQAVGLSHSGGTWGNVQKIRLTFAWRINPAWI